MPDTRRPDGYRARSGRPTRQHVVRRVLLVASAVVLGVWVAGGAAGPRATVARLADAVERIVVVGFVGEEPTTAGDGALADVLADPDEDGPAAATSASEGTDDAGASAAGGSGDVPDEQTDERTDEQGGPGSVGGVAAAQPMATLRDLVLHVPAERARLVAFHEAATVRARPLVPAGAMVRGGNDNPTRHDPVADPDPAGAPYRVQVSRGRSAAPTSAIDVVLADGVEVRSPVAGTVVDVREYSLYGRHDDVRVELQPDDAPALVVIMIHVTDPTVAPGDRVEVGDVVAAGARLFDFSSIVDNLVAPERLGHVHLEVARLDEVLASRRASAGDGAPDAGSP